MPDAPEWQQAFGQPGNPQLKSQSLADGSTCTLVLSPRRQLVESLQVSPVSAAEMLPDRGELIRVGKDQFHHIAIITCPAGSQFEFDKPGQIGVLQTAGPGAQPRRMWNRCRSWPRRRPRDRALGENIHVHLRFSVVELSTTAQD